MSGVSEELKQYVMDTRCPYYGDIGVMIEIDEILWLNGSFKGKTGSYSYPLSSTRIKKISEAEALARLI